jgi:hypothetical protein
MLARAVVAELESIELAFKAGDTGQLKVGMALPTREFLAEKVVLPLAEDADKYD